MELRAEEFIPWIVFWAVIGGLIGGLVWHSKGGRGPLGVALGAIAGLIGVIIVAMIKPTSSDKRPEVSRRECPHCKEGMRRDATVCPHCHRESAAWVFQGGYWWAPDGRHWYDERHDRWVEWAEPQA